MRMQSTNYIKIKNVTKSFGDVVAVSNLSLKVKKGSITGFLGPNGAGKSTTLKIIMGELKSNKEGLVRVIGEDPWNNLSLKRKIGYVSEFEDIYPFLTAKKYIEIMAQFYMSKVEAKKRTKVLLDLVNLKSDIAGKKPIGSFSKGMKQRMKVATALINDPELLILDEPFGGLDPLARREMKNLIFELNELHGKTILISSHILYEIEELSSQMILIHRGQTIASGKPNKIVEIIDRYPHTIHFEGDITYLKIMAKKIIEEDIVQTVTFKDQNLEVITHKPSEFYKRATNIIAENDLYISHMESKTDSVEAIFEYLTA